MRLSLALGLPLADLDAMPYPDFATYAEFYRRFGFLTDRLEHAAANAGAVVAASNGARVTPAELLPKFGSESREERRARLLAWARG